MTVLEGVTLAIAVLGAALGIVNTWHQLDRTKVKLRVTPKRAIPVGMVDPRLTFCIEITNLSAFAVTIDEAGVRYRGSEARGAYVRPTLIDGGPWPRRLDSRSSVSIYGEPPVPPDGASLRDAYAVTSCGVTRTGSSPAFRQLARQRA